MTAENIFKKHFEKQGYSDSNISPDAKKAIIDAMEEYANLKIAQKHESMHTMEQEEFKKGERVLVRKNGLSNYYDKVFLAEYNDKYYTIDWEGEVSEWDEIKKIEPVYRLLNVGEEIIEGDEIYNEDKRCWDYAYDKDIRKNVHYSWTPFRRKIKTYEE